MGSEILNYFLKTTKVLYCKPLYKGSHRLYHMKSFRINSTYKFLLKIISSYTILLPSLVIIYILIAFSVNVPILDQWIVPGFLFRRLDENGSIGFSDLFAQHNESRLVFSRIFFLVTAYLTHWDIRYELLAIFLAACQVAINIASILRRTIQDSKIAVFLSFSMGMLVFSIAQYENWMWGIQLVYFIPILCLTTGIIILYSNLSLICKIILLLVLSTLATFSYSNGMLCWALFPLASALILDWKSWQKCWNAVLIWLVSTVLNLGLYFWGYQKPSHHPSLASAFTQPIETLEFVLAFLGSPLSGGNLMLAVAIGGMSILLAAFVGLLIWKTKNREVVRLSGAWITIAAYVLLSALITMVGRLGFGMAMALSPRYTTFSLYWYVALLGLLGVTMENLTSLPSSKKLLRKIKTKSKSWIALISVTSIFLSLHILVQPAYLEALDYTVRNRLYAMSCLSYIDYVDDICVRDSIYPVLELLPGKSLSPIVESAKKLGILTNDRFAKSPLLTLDERNITEGQYGYFDAMKKTFPGKTYQIGSLSIPAALDSDTYLVSGWSILYGSQRAADAVLLAYQVEPQKINSQNIVLDQYRVFAVSSVQGDRPDIVKAKSEGGYLRSGWLTQFKRSSLPKQRLRIRAWSYDARNKIAYPLAGVQNLDASESQ